MRSCQNSTSHVGMSESNVCLIDLWINDVEETQHLLGHLERPEFEYAESIAIKQHSKPVVFYITRHATSGPLDVT